MQHILLKAHALNTLLLCLPVNVFFPLLLTLHAINEAATTTAATTSTTTTATTAPIIALDPLPEGPPPPVAGGSCNDVVTLLLSGMDDRPATEEDARIDDAKPPGETSGDVVIATPATEAIGEGEAADIRDEMELLMTSGTVHSKHRSTLVETHGIGRTGQLLSNHIAVETDRNVRRFHRKGLCQ